MSTQTLLYNTALTVSRGVFREGGWSCLQNSNKWCFELNCRESTQTKINVPVSSSVSFLTWKLPCLISTLIMMIKTLFFYLRLEFLFSCNFKIFFWNSFFILLITVIKITLCTFSLLIQFFCTKSGILFIKKIIQA